MTLKFLLLSLAAALFMLLSPTQAAPTPQKCTLTDVHKVIAEWRTDNGILLDAYKNFGKLILNFEIIESRLADSCDGLEDHLSKTQKFLAFIQPAAQIPKLGALIKPVQKIGDRLNVVILKKPHDTVCKAVLKVRNRIDNIVTKFKKVNDNKIVTVIKAFDTAHTTVDSALKVYKDSGGNPTNCVQLDALCAAAKDARDFQRSLIKEIKDLIDAAGPLQTFLDQFDTGVSKVAKFVDNIFVGPVKDVFDGVTKLMNTKISLPIPRGAKERGVGVIPKCCPSGRNYHAGLCYTTCRSGYAQVLFTCVEKCKSGWTDLGVTCTRTVKKKVGFIKISVPQFHTKHSYTRSGKAPAVFGNAACSCRSDKKYLEAGLCYNKCGRDHLSNYKTSFLTQCLDLRETTLSIADLAENLDIFKKAEDIPALGEGIKEVNKIIEGAFNKIAKPIADALNLPGPPINFNLNMPGFELIDKLGDTITTEFVGKIENLAGALLRASSCKDKSA